jgi:thiol-disulfide isomerase/thioredoxin
VKLSDHKDKDIILLDFFASWCGPCRVAMPVVHEVAEEYKDKGVKLYAVNVREPKDKIQKFLDSAELGDIPILLDSNGRVAMDYGATSIPRMILIGKDGTVQAIHAGYSPYLKQQLKENLDTLLKGEKLAPAPGA